MLLTTPVPTVSNELGTIHSTIIIQFPAKTILQDPAGNDRILLQDPGKLLQDSCTILQEMTGFSCKILLKILGGSFCLG